MLPYVLLLLFVMLLGIFLCERKKSRRRDLIFLVCVSVAMVAFSALRGPTVGVDNGDYYIPFFERVCREGLPFLLSSPNSYLYEPAYGFLNYVISLFTHNVSVLWTVLALLDVGLAAVLAYRHSSSVWVCIFTFVSFGFFGYTMITLRQQTAICIFLFAIPWLQRKKFLPYLLLVVLAAMFHKSLWLMLPAYFIAWIPVNWKSLSVYGAGTLFVLIFTGPIFDFVTKFAFQHYTQDNYYRAVGRNFQTIVVPVLLFAVALLLKKRLLARNPANLPLINFAGYSCFLFIVVLKTFIIQRVALLFFPIAVLLVPEILACMGVAPAKLAELERMKGGSGGNKKQLSPQYVQLKLQVRDEKALYYATLGFILFTGWAYYFFLQVANRLLLVPYVTIFHG